MAERTRPSPMSGGSVARRSARWSASPTASSTTGPAPACCAPRWPRPGAAGPNGATRTTTCSSSRSSSSCSTPASRSSRPAGPSSACARTSAPTWPPPTWCSPGPTRSWPAPTARWSTCWPAARASSTSSRCRAWSTSSTPTSCASSAASRSPPARRHPGAPAATAGPSSRGVTGAAARTGRRTGHPVVRGPRRAVRFAHPSERLFAALLDLLRSRWDYEPVEFALRWDDGGSPRSGFRPDFWLPDHRLLRRADHGRPAPGDPQERQGPPAARALPRGGRGGRLPAGLPGPAGHHGLDLAAAAAA